MAAGLGVEHPIRTISARYLLSAKRYRGFAVPIGKRSRRYTKPMEKNVVGPDSSVREKKWRAKQRKATLTYLDPAMVEELKAEAKRNGHIINRRDTFFY